jgi:hypothetical protein
MLHFLNIYFFKMPSVKNSLRLFQYYCASLYYMKDYAMSFTRGTDQEIVTPEVEKKAEVTEDAAKEVTTSLEATSLEDAETVHLDGFDDETPAPAPVAEQPEATQAATAETETATAEDKKVEEPEIAPVAEVAADEAPKTDALPPAHEAPSLDAAPEASVGHGSSRDILFPSARTRTPSPVPAVAPTQEPSSLRP